MTENEPPPPETLILSHLNAPPPAMDWLSHAQQRIATATMPQQEFMLLSAQARRHMGSTPLVPTGWVLKTSGGPLPLGDWPLGDAVRVLLLLQAVQHCPEGEQELVIQSFQQGDELERSAIIRGLMLLPHPCNHKAVALEAGRATSLDLYAALALDNPYPAACYDEHQFNQTVLKCLFTGLKVERITGLQRRANPTLSHMCEDYLDERLAADREVPRDIWLGLAPYASERATGLLIDYLSDSNADHRYYTALAATALMHRSPQIPRAAELTTALAQRRECETEPMIREILGHLQPHST